MASSISSRPPGANYQDKGVKNAFAAATRPENFFPYGGGNVIYSGRFFAKQEILAAVALLVLKFEMEVVEWVKGDGSKSERPAEMAHGYVGAGVAPPDRDLVVRMRRVR